MLLNTPRPLVSTRWCDNVRKIIFQYIPWTSERRRPFVSASRHRTLSRCIGERYRLLARETLAVNVRRSFVRQIAAIRRGRRRGPRFGSKIGPRASKNLRPSREKKGKERERERKKETAPFFRPLVGSDRREPAVIGT